MATIHVVQQGDCPSSIASDHAFGDWWTIYGDPANADFHAKRPNDNLVYPGDEIVIPDKVPPVRPRVVFWARISVACRAVCLFDDDR